MKQQQLIQKPPTKWCGLLSVRILTALMCAFLIISSTTAALLVTFTLSFSAANNVAKTHVGGMTTQTKNDIETFLLLPISNSLGWQFVHGRNSRPIPKDNKSLNPLWYLDYWSSFVASMRRSDFRYTDVALGFSDGNMVSCMNTPNDQFLCYHSGSSFDQNNKTNRTTHNFARANYNKLSEIIQIIDYDPRKRPFFSNVPHVPGAIAWSPVYLLSASLMPCISVNSAIFNETGTMLGIMSVGVGISELDNFIKSISITQNSVSFLIDIDDILLVTSHSIPAFTNQNITLPYTQKIPYNCLKADLSQSSAILMCRETITSYPYQPLGELKSSYPNIIDRTTNGDTPVVTLDGTDYFISVAWIETPDTGVDDSWRIVVFVPLFDIVGGIIEGRDLAIYISVTIIIVSVIVSYLFVTLLLRPLNAVAEDMYRVASLQDVGDVSGEASVITGAEGNAPQEKKGTPEPSLSLLSEIATLQFAFNTMRTEIGKIKSYLPQSVLAQLYGSDEISDEGDAHNDHMEHSGKDIRSVADDDSRNSQHRKCQGSLTDGHTVTSSHSGTNQSATLNTAISLSHRRVTMMSINIVGYHATLSSKDSSKISRIQSELVTGISSACSEHRGVLDGFQGDRFLASFNAVTSVGNHSLNGAYAAHTACRTADTMRTPLKMTAGIASGSAIVGNMGSTTIKRFTILGHVVSTAVTLERLAKRYRAGGGVLAGGVAITDVENFFDVLTVDAAVLPISTASAGWRARIAAVMSPKNTASEEWMYELKEGSAKSCYGDANLAFAAFLEGNHAEASRIVGNLCDGKHDPDSTSVGGALKKLLSAEPAIDGKRYVSPMTDFYLQCVLPNGNTAATNMSRAYMSSLNSSLKGRQYGSSVLVDNCGGEGVCGSSLIWSRSGSVLEIEKFGDSKVESHP